MKNRIEVKSPATLIDELTTAEIKLWVLTAQKAEADIVLEISQRCSSLIEALGKALGEDHLMTGCSIDSLIKTNIKCFFAQEDLFSHSKAGEKEAAGDAAMEVHHLNAERNNWIREIDEKLGYAKVTQLPKTYE